MDIVRDLVRNIALIVLLASFVDMLLPGKKMERYLKLIIGLFIIVTVLNPIMNLLGESQNFEITAWQYQPADKGELESIFKQGEELAQVTKDAAWEEYQDRVERQIVSLVKLVPRVKEVQVDVSFEDRENHYYGSIRRVVLVASVSNSDNIAGDNGNSESIVEPIDQINIGQKEAPTEIQVKEQNLLTVQERKNIEEHIKQVICDFYGLQGEQITVTAVAEGVDGGDING